MEVDYSFLAESAEVGGDGGFNAIGGGISAVNVPKFPFLMQAISVVACLRFSPDECEKVYGLTVTISRPDGSDVGLRGTMELRPTASDNLPFFWRQFTYCVQRFWARIHRIRTSYG
jgi:hypothetical protein